MPLSRGDKRTRSPPQIHNTRNTTTPSTSNKRIRARLEPTTLSVASARVRKTWRPLPSTTQDHIRTLLLSISAASQSTHLARTSRSRRTNNNPNTTNPAKVPGLTPDEHAEAIAALTRKLLTRLPKMQFPPSTSSKATRPQSSSTAAAKAAQEAEFDYEATLAASATLSAQLTDADQSAKLLRASIKAEEADLQRERAELANLRDNFKRSVAAQRDLEKRLHGVARGVGGVGRPGRRRAEAGWEGTVKREIKAEDDDFGEEREGIADATLGSARRRTRSRGVGGLDESGGGAGAGRRLLSETAIDGDEDLKALAKQLRSHLGSMAGNTAGMKGVASELRAAEAAVAAFAWKGMSRERYERVMGLR